MKREDMDSDAELLGMEAAFAAARRALAAGEIPIGAAVVMNGAVVSARYTEDVAQGRRLVHADFLALDDADRLKPSVQARANAVLYVTLEPCLFCMGAAAAFGIGEVSFALESPTDGASDAVGAWAATALSLVGYSLPRIRCGDRREESLLLLRDYVDSRSSGGLWRWARTTLDALSTALPTSARDDRHRQRSTSSDT